MSSSLIRWAAPAAVIGGLLWALFPFGTLIASINETPPGTLAHQASLVYWWLMAVVPLLLLLVGLVGLHACYRGAYGRLGKVGFFVSFTALSLMFVGNAVEVASFTFSGSESAAGHFMFLIGFLLLLIGSAPLGITLVRNRPNPASRIGGLLFVGALPLGILLAVVLGAVAPGTDLGFWAAITVPYGVAWLMLGPALRSQQAGSAGQPARVT
jgi:hypothetical protein